MMAKTISVIIPAHNEAAALVTLLPELRQTLLGLGCSYEVFVIDDGSSDSTPQVLKSLSAEWAELTAIRLSRSAGQTGALQAGFDRMNGELVVTMDADGQNDPADIPRLIDKLKEGYDGVIGWRTNRKDPGFARILPSRIANYLIHRWTGSTLHDHGCGLKIFRQEILANLRIYGEQHRYLGALLEGLGASVTEIPVNHRPRDTGQSHYGWGRVPRVILDLLFLKYILSYSHRPLHLFGMGGLIGLFLGFALCFWVSFEKIVFHHPASDRPLLLLGVLLVMVGMVLISLGILAELLVRNYHEATGKPVYSIKEIIHQENS